jgi:hypothetical protein
VALIVVQVGDARRIPAASAQTAQVLRQQHRLQRAQADDFGILNTNDVIAKVAGVTQAMTAFLGSVGGGTTAADRASDRRGIGGRANRARRRRGDLMGPPAARVQPIGPSAAAVDVRAPRPGFEPGTYRLTAGRSTVELSRSAVHLDLL